MGMFDNVIVDFNKLPLTKKELKLLKKENCDFQTKDFENILTEVIITEDDRLQIKSFEYESVPENERPHPDATGILKLAGSMRQTNIQYKDLNYNGTFRFYTGIGNYNKRPKDYKFIEFEATFTKGYLDHIIRIIDEYSY